MTPRIGPTESRQWRKRRADFGLQISPRVEAKIENVYAMVCKRAYAETIYIKNQKVHLVAVAL